MEDVTVNERTQAVIAWGRRLSAEFQRTHSTLAAGGLAYFVALSLAPAALAFGTLAGLILSPSDVRSALQSLVDRAPQAMTDLKPVVDGLLSTIEQASASAFTITTVVSFLIAIYAASKVVFGVRMALNSAFGIDETRSGLFERAVSAVATLVVLVVGVVLVTLLTLAPSVMQWLGITDVRLSTGSWLIDWALAVIIVFVVVRWTMRHASSQRQPIGWWSGGAWLATLGIVAASAGVGLYARLSASLSAAVVVFGTPVVILLWLYLCFVSLLWGAIVEADGRRPRTP